MVKPPCCDKLNVTRGLWSANEDAKMLSCVSKHEICHWTDISKRAGLRRCGKSCRLRWANYLRHDTKHESFTPQEEELIIRLHATIGSRWSIIAQQLPGRTDNDVKNCWNTKLRKKLSEMGIDPVTHKPFSQILSDYGNIGVLTEAGTRIGSLSRDLKNAFAFKTEQSSSDHPERFSNFSSQLTQPQVDATKTNILSSSHHSLELLAQVQAMALVTESSICTNHEAILPQFSSDTSASSSASCSSSTVNQVKSPLNFSWHDFLLDDALPPVHAQEQEVMECSPNASSIQIQNDMLLSDQKRQGKNKFNSVEEGNNIFPNSGFKASSSPDSSFVEDMLGQQNDMLMEFNGLLEDSCFY